MTSKNEGGGGGELDGVENFKKNVDVERRIKMKENSENEEGDERLKKKRKNA